MEKINKKADPELTTLYEKLLTFPLSSPEYKKCLEDIGSLEYRNLFGKNSSGEKKGKENKKPVRFLKGTY
ncbi:hypothetical protein [Parabacteroides pacaensis]|uniref:hypothetical protein n=1 Tax=Parabacteroides pacaensis TaxID=2086575 RepID=UPI000D0FE88E|nr:hypothetical protein [Parabacteroides pacaensis]